MNTINIVNGNPPKLRPWQYVAKDIIAALGGVETKAASDLAAEVSTLEGTIASEVSALDERITSEVSALETAIASEVSALDERITSEVSALEGLITSEAEARTSAINAAIEQEVSDRNAAIEAAISDLNSDLASDISAIQSSISSIESDISSIQSAIDSDSTETPGLTQRLAAVESTLNTNETGVVSKLNAAVSNISALQTTYAATDTFGLAKVSDAASSELDASDHFAATPKAVYDALQDAYSYVDSQLAAGIAGAYKYKGSVTDVTALPASDAEGLQVGDIYNVQSTIDGENDGVNYAWTGSAWDSLGGILKVENAITAGNGSSASPLSVKAAKDYVDGEISTVNGTIASVQTDISTIQGQISNESTETPGILQRLAQAESDIAANASDIASNLSAIQANASDIDAIELLISNTDTQALGLTQRVDTLEDQMNASSTGVLARLQNLETGAPTSVTAESESSGSTVTVTKDSNAVAIYNTTGDFTLAFTAGAATVYSVKEILLHATGDTTLTVTGAVFADAEEDPDWGKTGYELYLRATFINGEVILQVLSNSQEAYNANQYTSA